jgi:acyl transferase domain-containing protein
MTTDAEGIAIVGMAGRFPGAADVRSFWQNIRTGRDTITRFDATALDPAIARHAAEREGEPYVCAKGMLDDIDKFDAGFFGYLPRDAEVMDPQHRIFLEICHEALENAGTDPNRYDGAIGCFAGCYMDTYILHNLCADEEFRTRLVDSIQVGTLQTELGNDKDYLATRVAFKLGLRGPAMTLQTACSTSLVAIATACQSLETYSCDMALAGGVTIVLPQYKGYSYKEGSMLSPDGHCRPFDADAAGTVFSNGAAVVVLKRLSDAIADRDTIYAVIKGYATNNDGARKVSYTAPSVEGQAEVIGTALGMAGISARTIGYVEAHGTATPLGDPIEISGLTQAYRHDTQDSQYCAIGSVKANLGHLDVASGAIGTIKTALMLRHRLLTPLLHFKRPNPRIPFKETPFVPNTELKDWPAVQHPRRAGVSSFGVGGTNAHIVLEEAPELDRASKPARPTHYVLPVSARTLAAASRRLADLEAVLSEEDMDLADAGHTLRSGRGEFGYRAAMIMPGDKGSKPSIVSPVQSRGAPELVFLFPGQGSQYPGMARELYATYPSFAETVDSVSTIAAAAGVDDLRELLLWEEGSGRDVEMAASRLTDTSRAQPALFAVEVGLARLLAEAGLPPTGLVGHSVGEFAAAVIAGVCHLEDAARLVVSRGQLMGAMPPGAMLAVRCGATELPPLPDHLGIAAINSPDVTIVAGPFETIEPYEKDLATAGIDSSRLRTSHAFHSAMMADAAVRFRDFVADVSLRPARLPIHSTSLGDLAEPDRWAEASYWHDQILNPVLFGPAVRSAASERAVFVEVGPGRVLSGLTAQNLTGDNVPPIISISGQPGTGLTPEAFLTTLARLWTLGAAPDWSRYQPDGYKIALPTYPFERQRHWVDPKPQTTPVEGAARGTSDVETLIRSQLQVVEAQLRLLREG